MLDALKVVMALAAILGFVVLLGLGIVRTWRAKLPPPPSFSDGYLYVSTALAALVGGIVAVEFHQQPLHGSFVAWIAANLLIAIYALSYVVLGLAAVVTWVSRSDLTPPLVKNLATTFLGLAVLIVSTFVASA